MKFRIPHSAFLSGVFAILCHLSSILFSLDARAQITVQYPFADFTGVPLAVKQVYITPLWTINESGTNLIPGDRLMYQTGRNYGNGASFAGTSGSITLSNVVYGGYRVEFQGNYTISTFTNVFPTSIAVGAVVNAKDYRSTTNTVLAGGSAYSMAAADARFVNASSGSANNLAATNLTISGTFKIGPGSTTNQFLRQTNAATGAGEYSAIIEPDVPSQVLRTNGNGGGLTNVTRFSTNIIYVSASVGSDTSYAIGEMGRPVATVQKAMLLAQAYTNAAIVLTPGDSYCLDSPLVITNADGTTYPQILSPQSLTIEGNGAIGYLTNAVQTTNAAPLNQGFVMQLSGSSFTMKNFTVRFAARDSGNRYGMPFTSPNAVPNAGPYPAFLGIYNCVFDATWTNAVTTNYAVDVIIQKWATNMVISGNKFYINFDGIIFNRGQTNFFCLFENNLYVSRPTTNTLIAPNSKSHGPAWNGGIVLSRNNTIVVPAASGETDPVGNVIGIQLSRSSSDQTGTVMTNIGDTLLVVTNAITLIAGSPAVSLFNCAIVPFTTNVGSGSITRYDDAISLGGTLASAYLSAPGNAAGSFNGGSLTNVTANYLVGDTNVKASVVDVFTGAGTGAGAMVLTNLPAGYDDSHFLLGIVGGSSPVSNTNWLNVMFGRVYLTPPLVHVFCSNPVGGTSITAGQAEVTVDNLSVTTTNFFIRGGAAAITGSNVYTAWIQSRR